MGLFSFIKKGIKKIINVVKKVAPYVIAAAAIYFTAGLALSAFGPTAAFASQLPGWGATGLFTKAATFMGLGGLGAGGSGLHALAATKAAEAAAMGASVTPLITGSTAGGGAGNLFGITGTAADAITGTVGGMQTVSSLSTTLLAAKGTTAAATAMGGLEKFFITKSLLDFAGGFFEPTNEELLAQQLEYQKQLMDYQSENTFAPQWGFFGMNREGDNQPIYRTPNFLNPFTGTYTRPEANDSGNAGSPALDPMGPTEAPQVAQGGDVPSLGQGPDMPASGPALDPSLLENLPTPEPEVGAYG